MPQLATLDIKAHQLRLGDKILSVSGKAHPVNFLTINSVEVKTKLVHVASPIYGRKFTIPLDADVKVEREVPTDEDLVASHRDYQLETIQKFIAEAPSLFADAREGLVQYLDGSSDRLGWPLSSLIKARVNQDLWRRVEQTAQHYEPEAGSFVRAYVLILATSEVLQCVKDDLTDLSYTSRSTSVLHNAIEDCVREAKAQWVRQVDRLLSE